MRWVADSVACRLEAASFAHEAYRVIRMNRERHLPIPVLPSRRQRRLHHGLADASVLKHWLRRDAELRSLIINAGQTLTIRSQPHPTGADSLTVHDGDEAHLRGQTPALCIDAYTWVLKDLDWPQWRRRWVPESDMRPVPQALLIRSEKVAEVEQT